MFLDAAAMLRGRPRKHLLVTWAGLVMQQPRKVGRAALTYEQSYSRAAQMLAALESSSLVNETDKK